MDRAIRRKSLGDFIPWASPGYETPYHLAPLIERFEMVRDGIPQRAVIHAPPRHSKTETLLHFVPWLLQQQPEKTCAYVTYSATLSDSKSLKARTIAERAGVSVGGMNRLSEWRTPEGGGLLATGVGGPLTGKGVDVALVDDPIKNRLEAESSIYRNRLGDWFGDVLYTRIEPGGSCFVFSTRWHPDDLPGRLIADGWDYIRLPAISDDGKALWPSRWPLEALEEKREQVGEYTWASLYQGVPRSRGGAVFSDPIFYENLPTNETRTAIGVDLSYTKKTTSDYSVALTMLESKGFYYVTDVRRVQVRAPEFKMTLRSAYLAAGRPRMRIYCSGIERGAVDLMNDKALGSDALPLEAVVTQQDKFVRAQPVAAAWNAGKVLVPKHAQWLDAFLAEVASFTGVNDEHDDQVDSMASAFDCFAKSVSYEPLPSRAAGFRRV